HVSLDTPALVVHPGQVVLGTQVAPVGRFAKPRHRLHVIPRHAAPGVVHHSKVVLCRDITLPRRFAKVLDRLPIVLGHEHSGGVRHPDQVQGSWVTLRGLCAQYLELLRRVPLQDGAFARAFLLGKSCRAGEQQENRKTPTAPARHATTPIVSRIGFPFLWDDSLCKAGHGRQRQISRSERRIEGGDRQCRRAGAAQAPVKSRATLNSDMAEIRRRKTATVAIGGVRVGSDAPVVVQSMTNTDTADVRATIEQAEALARAGSELVRVTVNNDAAAAAVPQIVEGLEKRGVRVPIIGDFHYNGHILLKKYPECARALAKYRINPGNVNIGKKHDENFRTMIEDAIEHDRPVRIGVNWGSLDQTLLTRMMDENSRLTEPKDAREVTLEAMVVSALESARMAEHYGLPHDRIILSAKVSGVQDLIDVYRSLGARCDYPLHLGLTEAGMGSKGIVATTAALAI